MQYIIPIHWDNHNRITPMHSPQWSTGHTNEFHAMRIDNVRTKMKLKFLSELKGFRICNVGPTVSSPGDITGVVLPLPIIIIIATVPCAFRSHKSCLFGGDLVFVWFCQFNWKKKNRNGRLVDRTAEPCNHWDFNQQTIPVHCYYYCSHHGW